MSPECDHSQRQKSTPYAVREAFRGTSPVSAPCVSQPPGRRGERPNRDRRTGRLRRDRQCNGAPSRTRTDTGRILNPSLSTFVASSCDGTRRNCRSARSVWSSFTQPLQPTADWLRTGWSVGLGRDAAVGEGLSRLAQTEWTRTDSGTVSAVAWTPWHGMADAGRQSRPVAAVCAARDGPPPM
jgi:hypothetical protein